MTSRASRERASEPRARAVAVAEPRRAEPAKRRRAWRPETSAAEATAGEPRRASPRAGGERAGRRPRPYQKKSPRQGSRGTAIGRRHDSPGRRLPSHLGVRSFSTRPVWRLSARFFRPQDVVSARFQHSPGRVALWAFWDEPSPGPGWFPSGRPATRCGGGRLTSERLSSFRLVDGAKYRSEVRRMMRMPEADEDEDAAA